MGDEVDFRDVTGTVDVCDTRAVARHVRRMFERRYSGQSFAFLEIAFADVERLYGGESALHLACETPYHDLRHVLDVALAAARMIDGHDRVESERQRLGAVRAALGVIAALFHDSGYLRRVGERNARHGAEFTRVHVGRSAELLARHLTNMGLGDWARTASQLVHCTGFERRLSDLTFDDARDRRLGWILGSADLLAQLSDRCYLERCREHLYREFLIGGIAREAGPATAVRYASPEHLLASTQDYVARVAHPRLARDLGGVHAYAACHFGGPHLYLDRMQTNWLHLRRVIAANNFAMLRRRVATLAVVSGASSGDRRAA